MTVAYFALQASTYVWEALQNALKPSSPDVLLEGAVERLRAHAPSIERRGSALIVVEDGVADVPARALELERIVSAEPYAIDGGPMFLPFACAGLAARPRDDGAASAARAIATCTDAHRSRAALVWNGSLAASRLVLFAGTARVGGEAGEIAVPGLAEAAVLLETRGHHLYVDRATTDEDIITLLEGVPLHRQRFSFPRLLFVARRSAPAVASTIVLFESTRNVPYFAHHAEIGSEGGHDAFARTALTRLGLTGVPHSLVLVQSAALDRSWLDRLASTEANVKRTASIYEHTVSIIAEGEPDALVVHADHMREHFADRAAKLADAIHAPGETPRALLDRVSAALRGG